MTPEELDVKETMWGLRKCNNGCKCDSCDAYACRGIPRLPFCTCACHINEKCPCGCGLYAVLPKVALRDSAIAS